MATVLIVDDDAHIRYLLRELLADECHTTVEAENGVVALTRLRQATQPLIALVDITMPHLDGIGLLQHVQNDVHLATMHAFVVMTAKSRTLPPALVRLMEQLHMNFLGKPFDLEHILLAIAEATQRLALPPPTDSFNQPHF